MSREELAFTSGVSFGHLGRIERGEASPTVDVIERLGKALRTSGWRLMQEAERGA